MGEEIFDVFDENNRPVGRVPRSEAHRRGLYHRSVHVLLFNGTGELLLQRRALDKDVCPGLWDLSCGEHLQAGETYEAGARRGLQEELGIDAGALPLTRLRPVRLQRHVEIALGIDDREFVELWRATHDGPLTACADEVSAIKFVPLEAV
ncbi:MAG TPA: NUDIX domain-containing protein, partial [Myxococcota bacterium]|nr:NUDIX domain-containing protein [Myxococcota bacterium]